MLDTDALWGSDSRAMVLRSLSGKDLKDHVFRVDRSNGKVQVVALGGIF